MRYGDKTLSLSSNIFPRILKLDYTIRNQRQPVADLVMLLKRRYLPYAGANQVQNSLMEPAPLSSVSIHNHLRIALGIESKTLHGHILKEKFSRSTTAMMQHIVAFQFLMP